MSYTTATITNPHGVPVLGPGAPTPKDLGIGTTVANMGSATDPATSPYLRVTDYNKGGRGAAYDKPAAYTQMDPTQISDQTANNAGFNQLMLTLSQHFEPMMQISVHDNPRWWHDRIPRGAFTLFNGASRETRIFRGGLLKYAGLDEWQDIATADVLKQGKDPCAPLPFSTYKYGWESLSWKGKRAAWGSDPICADMFKFVDQAQQQLAWILSVGAEYGIQMQEVWNRDMFIFQSNSFDRSFVMSSTFDGASKTSPRYIYNPFTYKQVGETILKLTGGRPFVAFDSSAEVEPLNFDVLDQVRESLKIRCRNAAVSTAGGDPLFALAVSHDDVERYIRGNEEERKYWIEANPQALIQHYGFAPSTFRRWVITNDGNQLRFKIKGTVIVDEAIQQELAAVTGDTEFFAIGTPVTIATVVEPMIESPTRVGVGGTPIPEDNPEYYRAELAIAPIFMNHVFTNQFVPSISSLGSGTSFGPVTGLNGNWGWLNIQTPDNPFRNKGNFYGMFEIVPKPETHVVHAISFLYKRCTEPLPSLCPVKNAKVNRTADMIAKVTKVIKANTTEDVIADVLLSAPLLASIGDVVTVKNPGEGSAEVDAYIVGVSGVKVSVQLPANAAEIASGAEVTVA